MFQKIDLKTWERREIYSTFMESPEVITLTTRFDVTKLWRATKKMRVKFAPCLIYVMTKVVNQIKEFRCAIENEQIGYMSELSPLYADCFEEGTFTAMFTKNKPTLKEFYEQYINNKEKYKNFRWKQIIKEINTNDFFSVSIVPQIDFMAFTRLPIIKDPLTDFRPFFVVGGVSKQWGKYSLPIAIHINHAVADGYHVAEFIHKLKIQFEMIAKEIYETNISF